MDLLVAIYGVTGALPESERYNLVSQANRAALSVPANIAEGWGRGRSMAQANFIRISRGSLFELSTILHAIERVGLDKTGVCPQLRARIVILGRKINAYLTRLESSYTREEIAEYTSASGPNIQEPTTNNSAQESQQLPSAPTTNN